MTTQFPLTTTLNRIYACNPCSDVWKKELEAAGKTQADDEPITYEQILDAVGIEDALWCCQAEPQHARLWRLYAVWCARQVQHLMTDKRSIAALDIAERRANGQVRYGELAAAETDAWDAWQAAWQVDCQAAWSAGIAWVTVIQVFDRFSRIDYVAISTRPAADAATARAAQSRAFRQLVTTGTLP